MASNKLATSVVLCLLAISSHAAVTQKDFTGIGRIYVLESDDWRTANPSQIVGCLDDRGRFVSNKNKDNCGVFEHLDGYPRTLSSKEGNCTFNNPSAEKNTDSYYGKRDGAWSCVPDNPAKPMDALYTMDGFDYPFLCFGDVACFYDSKQTPKSGDELPLWQFRWGSMQRGVPPGHVQLQLMWEKVGNLSKKESTDEIPSINIQLRNVWQALLQGPAIGGRT